MCLLVSSLSSSLLSCTLQATEVLATLRSEHQADKRTSGIRIMVSPPSVLVADVRVAAPSTAYYVSAISLYYTVILYCTILYYTVLYCTILYYYTVLYCAILYYYTVLYYITILYYTILLYRTILYYTVLYYIILYYSLYDWIVSVDHPTTVCRCTTGNVHNFVQK